MVVSKGVLGILKERLLSKFAAFPLPETHQALVGQPSREALGLLGVAGGETRDDVSKRLLSFRDLLLLFG